MNIKYSIKRAARIRDVTSNIRLMHRHPAPNAILRLVRCRSICIHLWRLMRFWYTIYFNSAYRSRLTKERKATVKKLLNMISVNEHRAKVIMAHSM